MQQVMPDAHAELMRILRELEAHYKDMQDTEFTVEEGQLYMLQTRNAKRPAQAAVRFAVDAVGEDLLTREEALATIDANTLDALLHPTFDPKARVRLPGHGRRRVAGRRQGRDRLHRRRRGRGGRAKAATSILVRPFTEADDVAGLLRRQGHPHERGRQGQPRRARRARHGPPGGLRRVGPGDRPARQDGAAWAARRSSEGDLIAIDGSNGAGHDRRRAAGRARGRRRTSSRS